MGSQLPIGGIKLEIGGDIRSLRDAVREGKVSIEDLGKFLEQRIDKSSTTAERSVNRLVKELTGVKPTAQLNQLAVAVEKIGGVSKLSETQLANLEGRVRSLAAKGGEVPKAFQGMVRATEGLGAAVNNIKTDGIQRLTALGGQLGPLGGALGAIGPGGMVAAAGIGAAAAAAKSLITVVTEAAGWADDILDTASALGTTAEATQRLQSASIATGTDFGLVRDAIVKMQEAVVEAPEKLNGLGLSLDKLREQAPEEQFEAIATQLMKIEDPARRNAIAIEIFGKKWADLVPFVEAGFDAMKQATVISEETVKGLGNLKDSTGVLKGEWDALWHSMGGAVGKSPAIISAIEAITEALRRMQRGLAESKSLWDVQGNVLAHLLGLKGPAAKPPVNDEPEGEGLRIPQALMKRLEADLPSPNAKAPKGETAAERAAKAKRAADAERERQRMNAAWDRYYKETYGTSTGPFPSDIPEDRLLPKRWHDLSQLAGMRPPETSDEKARRLFQDPSHQAKVEMEGLRLEQQLYEDWVDRMIDKHDRWIGLAQSLPNIFEQVSGILRGLGFSEKFTKALKDLGQIGAGVGNMASAAMSGDLGGVVTGGISSAIQQFKFGEEHLRGKSKGLLATGAMLSPFALGPMMLGGIFGKEKPQQKNTGFESVDALIQMMSKGGFMAKDLASAFDAAFAELIPNAINKTTGLLDANAKKLLEIAKNSGIASQAIKDLMRQQAEGLAQNIAGGLASMKARRDKAAGDAGNRAKNQERDRLKDSGLSEEEIAERVRRAGNRAADEAARSMGIVSQRAASAMAASLIAAYNQMLEQGLSRAEAFERLKPAVQALREELKAAGYDGGAAFDLLSRQMALFEDEITGPLLEGIGSFAGALANLENMGLLTSDTFAGLTEQIGASIDKLKEQGVSEQDIMLALLPQLQLLWELQQKYGYEVDATTQKLINMAVEQGKVGNHMKSDSKQMVDLTKRIADAVELLARALAGAAGQAQRLRDKLKEAKDQAQGMPGGGGGGAPGDKDKPGQQDDAPVSAAEGWPLSNFGSGTRAVLHGWEAVLTKRQLESLTTNNYAAGATAAMAGLGGGVSFDASGVESRLDRLALEQSLLRESIRVTVRDTLRQMQQ